MRSERLLICLKTYLGDAVMASPMIDALEKEFDQVVIQTSPTVQMLLQDPIRSRRFISFSRSRSPFATIRTALELRKESFTTVVLVNRSFRAALLVTLAGIKTRVGHAKEGRGALLNRVVEYDESRFEADTCMDLARALGCEGPSKPELLVSQVEKSDGLHILEGATIGLQPGARYPTKQIPLHVLAELACDLSQHGHKMVLIGGADEHAQAERLQSLLPERLHSLVGRTDIRRTAGSMANLRLMIGGDTGVMHVAAGVGCPTLTVFGPTSSSKWGHNYAPHHVVTAPKGDMSLLTARDLAPVVRSALVL